ncbi:polynucleotide kinase-phosphatase [Antrihabitans sp. YC2-6]|uniref:polynucleotide kinase-phosphatase n=1 Tax=Antrihabitans sp. YC2-6 TaxID=2799498 RepID=UPI0018F51452|nr:polynucleotide kinase-phosphatase [Antrihabitans sp. YC2-6]MBJ8346221.1 polynucleotide kinase-phosphatase [Antrihabitans sp. YC2-6]
MSEISVPALSLVVLVGISGSGKSSFAAKHFAPTQVLSSDFCRGLVSDDQNDQSATSDAFDVLHYIAKTRLERGLLTVIDATNVQRDARKSLVDLAKSCDVLVDAIVLEVPERVALERNKTRPDRDFGTHVIGRQHRDLRRTVGTIEREGFRRVHILRGVDAIDSATIGTEKAWTDRRDLTGPFDIIGDVHGCKSELVALLEKLGWQVGEDSAQHPEGRTAVFVGDLVDRGPDTPGVLRLVMGMVAAGTALCVCGNHEQKLSRALLGRKVKVANGLRESLDQLAAEPEDFRKAALEFMAGLISHYQFDDGKLVVAHAGLKEAYHGRASGRVRSFALFGDTTGETDEYGLPVRYPWAVDYRGQAMVVYGHTPIPDVEWVNNTICLDTGVVFGGKLTALRYPSKDIVSVEAEQVWYESTRPFLDTPVQERDPALLSIDDVSGTRHIDVRHGDGKIKIREENSAAALEIMSRFAVDPRWLVYLPPTMSPCATSTREDFLEYPDKAFAEYAGAGVTEVVCEEKHMGSRAIVVIARDERSAAQRFGVTDGSAGMIYTRTGRPFFAAADTTNELVSKLREVCGPLLDDLGSDWLALDCELLPWSAKADALIRHQYASVGAAAEAALPDVIEVLEKATARGLPVDSLLRATRGRLHNARKFRDAYRRYCWPVDGLEGIQIAPFQILASEGRAPAVAEPHTWHLEKLGLLDDPMIAPTRNIRVDLTSDAARDAATAWWLDLTTDGGEGMVVKPLGVTPTMCAERRIQPAVKVRGREYLRIIYGPDYTSSLDALRNRSLGRKRSLALREHALGLEALSRLAAGDPLWRVHEPVFAVLALESEPVDPRL